MAWDDEIEYCELSTLPTSHCTHCINETSKRHYRSARFSGAGVQSAYYGHCVDCGNAIHPGDTIHTSVEGWKCESCR